MLSAGAVISTRFLGVLATWAGEKHREPPKLLRLRLVPAEACGASWGGGWEPACVGENSASHRDRRRGSTPPGSRVVGFRQCPLLTGAHAMAARQCHRGSQWAHSLNDSCPWMGFTHQRGFGEAKHGRWLVEHVLFLLLPFTYEGWGVWGPGIALRRQTTGVGRVVLSSILGTLRGRHARSHLLTIHLQDVGLEQLLVAGGVAGVIAHVDGGHLGDVEGVVLSEVLHRARKTTRSASHWAA